MHGFTFCLIQNENCLKRANPNPTKHEKSLNIQLIGLHLSRTIVLWDTLQ